MSRKEFMEQLERLLMDIPQEERIEALTYYNGYFEDAGEENEASIIQELESPEKVARIIKADMGAEEEIAYTETGYEDIRFRQQEEVGNHTGGYEEGREEAEQDNGRGRSQESRERGASDGYGFESQKGGASGSYDFETKQSSAPRGDRTSRTILLVLLAVLTSPIWIGLLGGVFGLAVGAVATIFALILAAVIIVAVFYIVGFVLAGVGISMFTVGRFAVGLGLSGSGCLMLAVAILGTVACVWLFGRFVPWLCRGIGSVCSRLFQRKGRMA